MKLHPVNPTPGVEDLPPPPTQEPVTVKDLVPEMIRMLYAIDMLSINNRIAYDKAKSALYASLNSLRKRL